MSAAGSRLMRERARSQQQHPKRGDEEGRDRMWFNAYRLTRSSLRWVLGTREIYILLPCLALFVTDWLYLYCVAIKNGQADH